MNEFVAIDVETANSEQSSICQIGLVKFKDGEVVDSFDMLVNPQTHFSGMNVSIHGITEEDVKGKPIFPELHQELIEFIGNHYLIHHTAFDRLAWYKVLEKYHLPTSEIKWIDSARVARRVWKEIRKKGYALNKLAEMLEIEFAHHKAVEDAYACGMVINHALKEKECTIDELIEFQNLSFQKVFSEEYKIDQEVNQDGPLFGDIVVFTGALIMPRWEATLLANKLGCEMQKGVNKGTTILVVGEQDESKLAGYEKSTKHRKAESMIEKGHEMQILFENDFIDILKVYDIDF